MRDVLRLPVSDSALLLGSLLGNCALALGTQLRLIAFQALFGLLALLTLTELLELSFARLCNLAIYLTTLGLCLSGDARHERGHEDECCHFHRLPLRRSGCS